MYNQIRAAIYLTFFYVLPCKRFRKVLLLGAFIAENKSRLGKIKVVMFSVVTRYAHHVFKAFDVTGTGSISFKAGNKFTLKPKILFVWTGFAAGSIDHFHLLHLAPNFSYLQFY